MGLRTRVSFWLGSSVITYLVMRYFFPENFAYNDNLSEKIEIDHDLNTRGGGQKFFTLEYLFKTISTDKAMRWAIFVLVGGTTTTECINLFRQQIINASPLLMTLPGFDTHLKLQNLLKTLPKKDFFEIMRQLIEVATDSALSDEEKIYLIRRIVKAALVSLRGVKKKLFWILLGYILLFFFTNYTPLFGALLLQLREVARSIRTDEGILNFIVETYKEYNIPFPEELMKQVENIK
jgi:hypothetical protein